MISLPAERGSTRFQLKKDSASFCKSAMPGMYKEDLAQKYSAQKFKTITGNEIDPTDNSYKPYESSKLDLDTSKSHQDKDQDSFAVESSVRAKSGRSLGSV